MIPIQYPEPDFKIKRDGDKYYIFDAIRKMWLLMTDEEWVRQNFVAYLTAVMQYPAALIALEKEILLNDLKKRFDVLVYDRQHQPWMLIECKAPQVALDESVLQQALRYNITLPVPYIVITNGAQTVGWHKVGSAMELLASLPRLV